MYLKYSKQIINFNLFFFAFFVSAHIRPPNCWTITKWSLGPSRVNEHVVIPPFCSLTNALRSKFAFVSASTEKWPIGNLQYFCSMTTIMNYVLRLKTITIPNTNFSSISCKWSDFSFKVMNDSSEWLSIHIAVVRTTGWERIRSNIMICFWRVEVDS